MSPPPPPRQALYITVATAACLGWAILALGAPSTTVMGLAIGIFAAAVGAGFAAFRRTGLDRWGWATIAIGQLVILAGQPGALHGSFTASLSSGIGMSVITAGLLTFTVRNRGDLVSVLLQWATLTAAVLIGTWLLGETPDLRSSVGPDHDFALRTDLLLVTGATSTAVGVLAAYARTGGDRWAFSLLASAMALGTVADAVTRLGRNGHEPVLAAVPLHIPEVGLSALAAAVAASIGRPGPRRPVLDHSRDLLIVSAATLLVAVGALLESSQSMLDRTLARALAALVCLLVLAHVCEARRHRILTRSTKEQERHMRLLVTESRDIIIELDRQGRVVFASEAMRNILGVRFNQYAGRHVSELIPELDDAALAAVVHAPRARIQPTMRVESVLTTAMGSVVHAESVVTPLDHGYLVAVRDVSERVGLQSRLRQVTYNDVATGLPNRASLGLEMRRRLYEADEISLVLIDLNTAGMPESTVGDESHEELLRTVGGLLAEIVRPGDLLSRFSDHRFAVLLASVTNTQEALAEADRIVSEVNDPLRLPDTDLHACAAVAVGGHSGAEIVRNAELALRQAQLAGPGSVRLFEPSMLAQFARTRDLRRRLARTPDTDRWTVLYQPVIDLQSGRVQGVEALLRWTDPEGDFIGIEEIIRLAEEFGSIIQIGSWVLDQAAAQAARWERSGRPLQVAVNVSVHQLTAPGFSQIVEETLERHALAPELLTLEITETVVLEQTEETIATLSELRQLGIRIAIDDFGTGYSGLANIRSLPLDILKIDRMFIEGLGQGGSDEAVVNAVTHLGLELGLAITAEGIETPEQERLARALGITAAQGYLYARPLPAADVTTLVACSDATADLPR